MPTKPLRTKAIVLRRTNYGETDRILNLLTPTGQLSVRARGVRKERSKLAGGIELFSVSDVVIQKGRSELGTLTSAKMLVFYQNILTDLPRLEFASSVLKDVSRASAQVDSPDFFSITEQIFAGLNSGLPLDLIKIWSQLNLRRATGEELNLIRDKNGAKLQPDQTYAWDAFSEALYPVPDGPLSAPHIKLLRLMTVMPLRSIASVKDVGAMLDNISQI